MLILWQPARAGPFRPWRLLCLSRRRGRRRALLRHGSPGPIATRNPQVIEGESDGLFGKLSPQSPRWVWRGFSQHGTAGEKSLVNCHRNLMCLSGMRVLIKQRVACAVFSGTLFIMGCSGGGDYNEVKLGNTCLRIPKENMVASSAPSILPKGEEYDPVQMVRAKFEISFLSNIEIQENDETSRRGGVISAVIGHEKDENFITSRKEAQFGDAWRGSGSYAGDRLGRRVVFDDKAGLYRIYMKEIPGSWVFSSVSPKEIDKMNYRYVIASCYQERSGAGANCLRTLIGRGFYVEYWVTGSVVSHYREIDIMILSKLSSWIHKCLEAK